MENPGLSGLLPTRPCRTFPDSPILSFVENTDRMSLRTSYLKEHLRFAPLLIVCVVFFAILPTYPKPNVLSSVMKYSLGVMAALALLFLSIRFLRRSSRLLAVMLPLCLLATLVSNTLLTIDTRFAEKTWQNRRMSNSLPHLAKKGNRFSKRTYLTYISLRDYLRGRHIVTYSDPVLNYRYLHSIALVGSYETREYPHVLNSHKLEALLAEPHETYWLHHKLKSRGTLIIIPSWMRKRGALYVMTSEDGSKHLLVPARQRGNLSR